MFSGLFDRLPGLTLILGHLGETLPYFAWRIQHCFEYNPADKRLEKRLQDYLCENVYLTSSGNFSDQALIAALLTVGGDRLLFAADYPYEMMQQAARWLEEAPISENDAQDRARQREAPAAPRLMDGPPESGRQAGRARLNRRLRHSAK